MPRKPESNQNIYAMNSEGRWSGGWRRCRANRNIAISGKRIRPAQYNQCGSTNPRLGMAARHKEFEYGGGAGRRLRVRSAGSAGIADPSSYASIFRPLYMSGVTYPTVWDSIISSCILNSRAASLSLFAHLNQIGTAIR